MMWISFAYSIENVLDGSKTSTIRPWSDKHAAKFKAGDIVRAYDKNPRPAKGGGGKPKAVIRITRAPFKGTLHDLVYERHRLEKEGHPADGGMTIQDFLDIYFPMVPLDAEMWCLEFELAPPEAG